MQIDISVLEEFFDKVERMQLTPTPRTSRAWRLKERVAGRISWFPENLVPWDDWSEALFSRREEILAWPETIRLVDHVHHATGAELPFIRGAVTEIAEAFLRNAASAQRLELVRKLGVEVVDLFARGLPVTFKSFLTGIEVAETFNPIPEIRLRPFEASDWPAWLAPGTDIGAPSLTDCSIFELEARFGALGQPFDPFDPKAYHWQKAHEKVLRILRLFRVGGVQTRRMFSVPTTLIRLPLHGQQSAGQVMASMFSYKLTDEDREPLGAHFAFLKDLPAWKIEEFTPLDVALERYETAISPGRYTEEVLFYSILGIEALFRQRETNRRASVRRVGRLMELAGLGSATAIEGQLDRAYEYRNPFVHGEALAGGQVAEVQGMLAPLLETLRLSALLFVGLEQHKAGILGELDASSSHRDRRNLEIRLKRIASALHLKGVS